MSHAQVHFYLAEIPPGANIVLDRKNYSKYMYLSVQSACDLVEYKEMQNLIRTANEFIIKGDNIK